MSAETSFASDSATAELKDCKEDTRVLRPGQAPKHFGVSQQPAWLRAFGLVDGDVLRVLMVGGDGTLTAPFRPKQADPAEDVALTPGRTSLPIYFPGRYVLERQSGGTAATVFAFNATVSHEAGSFYNEVTGDTVVNSIAVQNDSPGISLAVDNAFGDVTISSAVNLSADADNIITQEPDGFYATAVQTITPTDTNSIDMAATPTGTDVAISANVNISGDDDNAISIEADGLYAYLPPQILLIGATGALADGVPQDVSFTSIEKDSSGTLPATPFSVYTNPWDVDGDPSLAIKFDTYAFMPAVTPTGADMPYLLLSIRRNGADLFRIPVMLPATPVQTPSAIIRSFTAFTSDTIAVQLTLMGGTTASGVPVAFSAELVR